MMKREKFSGNEQGSIILETSLVLPIFMLIILCLYGLFVIFSAQNQMTHALVQASKSLSLDPYLTENVDSKHEADTIWGGLTDWMLDKYRENQNDSHFSTMSDWYSSGGSGDAAKKRFIGFLTGGDEDAAEEKLKSMGVVDGLSGVQIGMTVSGSEMTISMDYELQYWFDAFSLGRIPVHQTIRTRLWAGSTD